MYVEYSATICNNDARSYIIYTFTYAVLFKMLIVRDDAMILPTQIQYNNNY